MGKKASTKTEKTFKAVLKRYWYWFATIPVLIAVSFIWLYFIGTFDKVNAIVIRTSTPQTISMPVDSLYHMVITSETGELPVYTSSNPKIVEVSDDGYLLSHNEGLAKVTADFGKKKYVVTVLVSSLGVVWYKTAGDSFTNDDIFAAFPTLTNLQGVSITGAKYIETHFEDTPVRYDVLGGFPEDTAPVFIYVTTPDADNGTLTDEQRGVITLWLVQTTEEKDQRTAAYQKYLADQLVTPTIPQDQVDEVLEIECVVDELVLRPALQREGFVRFYIESDYDDFPFHLDQLGNFSVDASASEFFIDVVVDNKEVYRYKCSSTPFTSTIYLSVGETMYFDDYTDNILPGITKFSANSAKLQALYDDNEKLIGYKALESTDNFLYIYGSYPEYDKYLSFRFKTYISNGPSEEEEYD